MTRAALRLAVAGLALGLLSGCLETWKPTGLYACRADGTCADGLTCDDGLCCQPGGSPACPTLPVDGQCPNGLAPVTYYRDLDGDGAGDAANHRPFCGQPRKEAWVTTAGDCNDGDDTVNPLATERCNGIDDNCDGAIDEGNPRTTFYLDTDGDGFGDDCATCTVQACAQPKGYAARGGDCDPAERDVFPGAPERCNNRDDNCNGQKDDPPFLDVESPGFDGGVFPCSTGKAGACATGGLQCTWVSATARFETTCVPRFEPATDVCGDGVDNDCDGVVDGPPGCGGPPSLLSVKGGTTAAFALVQVDSTAASKLPARCVRHDSGRLPMAWLNPSWVGNDANKHTWFVEAPAGEWWDLSRTGQALGLKFTFTAVGGPGSNQANPPWGDGSWFRNAVVTLCGDKDTEYRRWVPPASASLGNVSSPWVVTLPLDGTPTGWTREGDASGFDLAHVRAVELTVSPVTSTSTSAWTFRIGLAPDAGFH